MKITYNWFGVMRDVLVMESRPDVFSIHLKGDEHYQVMGGMEKTDTGQYTAYAKGNFFKGSKDEAVLQLMNFMERETRHNVEAYQRVAAAAADRKAEKEKQQEQEKTFE